MENEQLEVKHKSDRKKLEEALKIKFFPGRNADWGGMDILPIKGDHYRGMFIVDMDTLTGEKELILMVRTQNPETDDDEDVEVYTFETEKEDINSFIQRLEWV